MQTSRYVGNAGSDQPPWRHDDDMEEDEGQESIDDATVREMLDKARRIMDTEDEC